MTDLDLLKELAEAEKNAKKRVEEAEEKAERIVAQAKRRVEREEKVLEESFKGKKRMRIKEARKEIQAKKENMLEEGVRDLESEHPDSNEKIDKSVDWVVDSFQGWLKIGDK